MNITISIIMPSYNAEAFIEKSLDSILAQTYKEWELIITDDCSTDSTKDIIYTYTKKNKRIKIIPLESNHGPGDARNKAIEVAQGRYITFLDSDDLWIPEKLEKQLSFMEDNNLSFSYASYFLIDEEDNDIGSFHTLPKITYHSMLKTCSVGCLTAMYDSKKLGKMYMPSMSKGEDYVLWLNIIKKIQITKGILEPLGYYRIRASSASSDKIHAAKKQWDIYYKIEKLNLFKSMYYLIHYTVNGLFKYK